MRRRIARPFAVTLTGVASIVVTLAPGGYLDDALMRVENALTSFASVGAVSVAAAPAHDEMQMPSMARSPSN